MSDCFDHAGQAGQMSTGLHYSSYSSEPADKHKFELEDGLRLCRVLEPVLVENGLHCALAGSLVYKGWSDKDIDIFIYNHDPKDVKSTEPDIVLSILKSAFKKRMELNEGQTGTKYDGIIKAKVIGKTKTYIVDFFIITK